MRTLKVVYHYEDGSWWAEADEVPDFVAGAATFEETRTLTHEGLEFDLDEQVDLDERFDAAAFAARRSANTITSRALGVVLCSRSSASTTGSPVETRPAAPALPVSGRASMASSAA
jgi:predicted RNase H-like HicB family nuclease